MLPHVSLEVYSDRRLKGAHTVSSKIIRTLEISHLVQFYAINIYEIMTFRHYTVFNKLEVIKMAIRAEKTVRIIASAPIILLPTVQWNQAAIL